MKYKIETWCSVCQKKTVVIGTAANHRQVPLIYCIVHKDNPTVLEIRLMVVVPETEEGQSPATA